MIEDARVPSAPSTSHIVAFGGSDMDPASQDMSLVRYLLDLTGKPRPMVCLLPQASGESSEGIMWFYATFASLPCRPAHLSLFKPRTADVRSFLLDFDLIFVGGGNTKSMLALWREWSLDAILREAWRSGIVLAGVSAGSICWFEQGLTDSIPGPLTPLPCLGFLPGSNCPHFDGEAARRPSYTALVAAGTLLDGYAADDGVGLHFTGTRLARAVSARPGARAYRFSRSPAGDAADETVIEPQLLAGEVSSRS
jgi:dipeptidase E